MNRLVLIGNGFDLAHKLPTSYNDFMLWYLKQGFNKAYETGNYKDELYEVERINHGVKFPIANLNNVNEFIEYFYQGNFLHLREERFSHSNWSTKFDTPLRLKITSSFFISILSKCTSSNWVDIENEYYSHLNNILKLNNRKVDEIQQLNNALRRIIILLEVYLTSLPPSKLNLQYRDILESDIELKELHVSSLRTYFGAGSRPAKQKPNQTHILNFNYTNTFEAYINNRIETASFSYIHGKIGDEKNPMIFGFGDELDNNYPIIEMEKTKGFFQYIKSFWYFKTTNYHQLVTFIDSDEYQVLILGHSCGLSDRTMLNMIFEHENCKSIKIYYHEVEPGKNNYTELTQEISRHFKDKGSFRKKVVNFEYSRSMPQVG